MQELDLLEKLEIIKSHWKGMEIFQKSSATFRRL